MNYRVLCIVLFELLKIVLCSFDLTVSTYNIWNVMFNWEVRKYKIAELIRSVNSDIIALQEICQDVDGTRNQILDIKEILPSFKWVLFRDANSVTRVEGTVLKGWSREGIGLLSKYPIVASSVEHLPFSKGPDTNKRIALHAAIQMPDRTVVNVVVVHFSYFRQQQCANAAAVLEFIVGKGLRNVIVLGDFNTYSDYDWPLLMMTQRWVNHNSPCYHYLHMSPKPSNAILTDVWENSGHKNNGLTFSNMPSPGFESRPDRILVDKKFSIRSASILGNGTLLFPTFHNSVLFSRFKSLLNMAYLARSDVNGYTCLQDCGPHGSCRCGMCVRDDQNQCLLKDCSECSADILFYFVIFVIIFIVVFLHILFSVVWVLVIASHFEGQTVFSILGCNCCLCNPKLFVTRKMRHRRFFRCYRWPLFKVPPAFLLIISVVAMILLIFIMKNFFKSSLNSINSIMTEEYYPSDHLLLTAHLEFPS